MLKLNLDITVETIVPESQRLTWYKFVKTHGNSVFSICGLDPHGLQPTAFQF